MSELDVMLQGLPPERQEAIRKRADELEVYFNNDGDLIMNGKAEGWDGKIKLPKGDAKVEGWEL